MAESLPVWTILLAALGLWFLVEGSLYALAPDAVQRFLAWAARIPAPELRQAGVWTAVLGVLLLYVGMRLI